MLGHYVDQALNYELAPSTQLNWNDVVCAIIGLRCRDMKGICAHLTSVQSTCAEPSVSSESITDMVKFFKTHYVYIGDKEASGRVIVGLFMEILREALDKKHPGREFMVDHEFKVLPTKRFAIDEAIEAVIGEDNGKVVFALEYKPKVASDLNDQVPFHISEMLLQAFYLTSQFDHDIVHCLTDLEDYHIFLIGKSNRALQRAKNNFSIKEYWYRKCHLTDSGEVAKHLSFYLKK